MADKNLIGIGTFIMISLTLLATIGAFNISKIILVRQGDDYVCPESIYQDFKVVFSNTGNRDASLCVNVDSTEINFTKKRDCLYLEGGRKEVPFLFKFNNTFKRSEEANITIKYSGKYRRGIFTNGDFLVECNYAKIKRDSNLKLISESAKSSV